MKLNNNKESYTIKTLQNMGDGYILTQLAYYIEEEMSKGNFELLEKFQAVLKMVDILIDEAIEQENEIIGEDAISLLFRKTHFIVNKYLENQNDD